MDGPEINERAFRLACRIVAIYQKLRVAGGAAWALAPQLLHAGTWLGANLEEATAGRRNRTSSRICISRKEAVRCVLASRDRYKLLRDEDIRMIFARREFVACDCHCQACPFVGSWVADLRLRLAFAFAGGVCVTARVT